MTSTGHVLAVAVGAATMALMTYWDFVHYSSEHMPLFLISVTLLMVCIYVKRARQAGAAVAALAGLLIGSMPYAKMQAVPLALALAARAQSKQGRVS